MTWRALEYDHDDKGSIILPDGPPFDGKPVLIRTHTGVVEAWWCAGEWSDETPDHPREYDGWYWVCYDDEFHVELDDARCWMPMPGDIPANPQLSKAAGVSHTVTPPLLFSKPERSRTHDDSGAD